MPRKTMSSINRRETTSSYFSSLNLLMRFFFFNDTATTETSTLSLHDALPIWRRVIHTHAIGAFRRTSGVAQKKDCRQQKEPETGQHRQTAARQRTLKQAGHTPTPSYRPHAQIGRAHV